MRVLYHKKLKRFFFNLLLFVDDERFLAGLEGAVMYVSEVFHDTLGRERFVLRC